MGIFDNVLFFPVFGKKVGGEGGWLPTTLQLVLRLPKRLTKKTCAKGVDGGANHRFTTNAFNLRFKTSRYHFPDAESRARQHLQSRSDQN